VKTPASRLALSWVLRGILVLLIALWTYDALIEPVPLLRGILALTVIAAVALLVILTQVKPGTQRVVLANLAGLVVFAGNVAYIALKSQGLFGAVIVALAAICVLLPWAVRFGAGIRRITIAEQQAATSPALPAQELSNPIGATEPSGVPVATTVTKRERPRYTLPGEPVQEVPRSRRARTRREPPAS
jgi:hypothetical protein